MVLVLMMMMSTIMVPAMAANDELSASNIDSTEINDAVGNIMKFELITSANGEYILNYYFNNSLEKTYRMSDGKDTIMVTAKSTSAQQQNYTLAVPKSEAVSEPVAMYESNELPLRIKDRWFLVGYINYSYSSDFECMPFALINYQTADSYNSTYTVNTYENSSFSDWIATITSSIISTGLMSLSPTTIAAAILTGLIGYFGGEVINDLISVGFTEEYDCRVTEYVLHACVYGDGMGENDVVEYDGKELLVTYDNAPDKDYYYEGWTPGNWKKLQFAEEIWDDSVPWWPAFPGVDSYTTYR